MSTFEPYCNDRCGRRATCEVPVGMSDGTPITEWLCRRCAKKATALTMEGTK